MRHSIIQHILPLALAALLLLPAGALAEPRTLAPAGEEILIEPVRSSDEYKDLLMDSFDQTVLAEDENVREQIKKILYSDEVVVDGAAYNRILAAATRAISGKTLSAGASTESYTPEDLAIALALIAEVCDALDLDFSIDPSNDAQNEYARVISVRKDGVLLGRINADAKTDVAEPAPVYTVILGGALIAAAIAYGLWLLIRRRSAVS